MRGSKAARCIRQGHVTTDAEGVTGMCKTTDSRCSITALLPSCQCSTLWRAWRPASCTKCVTWQQSLRVPWLFCSPLLPLYCPPRGLVDWSRVLSGGTLPGAWWMDCYQQGWEWTSGSEHSFDVSPSRQERTPTYMEPNRSQGKWYSTPWRHYAMIWDTASKLRPSYSTASKPSWMVY